MSAPAGIRSIALIERTSASGIATLSSAPGLMAIACPAGHSEASSSPPMRSQPLPVGAPMPSCSSEVNTGTNRVPSCSNTGSSTSSPSPSSRASPPGDWAGM